jgi:hypothetical protein
LAEKELEYNTSSGFVVNSTYCSMKRAWTGFRIAYREGNQEKMNYYLEGIKKFEKQLNHPVTVYLTF